MPIYEAQCKQCGQVEDYYQTASNCHKTPWCCGEAMTKVILTAPFGVVDIPAYKSPVSGKWINSRRERAEDLKQTGSRPWEGMEQEQKEADRLKAYTEAEQDKKLEKTIESTIRQLPEAGKAELGLT